MRKTLFLLLAAISFTACSQQKKVALSLDPDVRYGKLENGLTYYIRHNNTPENRADFYLVQKVGSMQEEDSQSGLAHFLEHMAFNGTENFPDKSMLNYLEENGMKFGEEINAYTSFDETVYNISNVPTTRQAVLDSCLLILHDWSTAIALHEKEIDKERGVIKEEWRSINGAQQRIFEKMLSELLNGSRYAERLPIGSMDIVKNFKYDELRAYYKKWYRPDLQGIIIVGEVDVDKTEQKIKDMFAHIKLDPNRAERIYYPVSDNDAPLVSIVTDPEARESNITIFFKHPPVSPEVQATSELFEIEYKKSIAINLLNERLSDMTMQPDAPFFSAEVSDGEYIVAKTKRAFFLSASCAENKIEAAMTALANEIERIKKFGITSTEYEWLRDNLLQTYQDRYNNRNKTNNDAYVKEYTAHFTDNVPAPGIEREYEVMAAVAARTSAKEVSEAFKKMIGEKNIAISVTGPDVPEIKNLNPDRLISILREADPENTPTEDDDEEYAEIPLVKTHPAKGSIVKEEENSELGASIWTLSNGMKIVLKNTDFENNAIQMSGIAAGGFSRYIQEDPINGSLIPSIMTLDGVGDLNEIELQKALGGKTVSATPSVDVTTQSFTGSSSVEDFETMLQLVYLYFTAPRTDDNAIKAYVQRMEAEMKNIDSDPATVFEDSISEMLYGKNPMFDRLKQDDLKKINPDRIKQMYKECFAHPGNFIFSFVGNINKEEVKPIILQYLGSLTGREENPRFTEVPLNFSEGGSRKKSFKQKMGTPKASVYFAFTGEMERSLKNMTTLSMLKKMLDLLYTEKVREDEGGTYGITIEGDIERYPVNQTMLSIQYDTDPAKMEKLNEIIIRELQGIAKNGPRQGDFDKVKTFMNKSFAESLKSNAYWRSILSTFYFYGEDQHGDYPKTLNSITPADVKDFVKKLLDQKNDITVIMTPEEK